ncbi:uncharacterized protein BDV17DRAFT_295933 [Aspergillus undulatus]|uniref:uncharacterized protein n=1 Tax=Aspergillus undulatus TaxID=1810928 RepID=UPI003CCDDB36
MSITVPTAQVEDEYYPKKGRVDRLPYHRAILDEPVSKRIALSEIAYGSLSKSRPRPVSIEPLRARVSNACGQVEDRWNATFHMANLFGPDRNREAGRRIGYPMHTDCWQLACRETGEVELKGNLRAFTLGTGKSTESWGTPAMKFCTLLESAMSIAALIRDLSGAMT